MDKVYYNPYMYPYRYPYESGPMYSNGSHNGYWSYPQDNGYAAWPPSQSQRNIQLKDYGSKPFVVNINTATTQNNTYRTALWTGDHLQLTLMSIKPGEDIGLEIHPDVDQFLRIEQGQGFTQMGKQKDDLNFTRYVMDDSAIFIPAGTWHNLTNTGNTPLKLYSIYAPPNHPFGTVHTTKAEAMAAED